MAVAHVQHSTVVEATTGAASKQTGTMGVATTAGNLLVILVGSGNSGIAGLAATGYTLTPNSNGTSRGYVLYKPNCSAGETAPTVTTTATFDLNVGIIWAEFSGVATTSPLSSDAGNATAGASSVATGTTDSALALLLGVGTYSLSNTFTQTSTQTFNNATAVGIGNNDATSAASHYSFAYGIGTANAGADTFTAATNSMNVNTSRAQIASFLPPAAGGSTDHFDQIGGGYYPMERLKNFWLPKRRKLWMPRPVVVSALVLP